MNPVYIRIALYFVAPLLGMVPGITHDPGAGTLTIDIETALIGIATSGAVAAGIAAKWAKK